MHLHDTNRHQCGPHLQDFASDVLLTALTLDAKHSVVVCLTVGDPISVDTQSQKPWFRCYLS